MNLSIKKISIGIGIGLLILLFLWFFFFRTTATNQSGLVFGLFGSGGNRTLNSTGGAGGSGGGNQVVTSPNQTIPKIFKIADGPVAGATFIETSNPTTTLARYVMQDNGHVFDLPMDVPGAAARVISNTTIPSIAGASWARGGGAAILQYIDKGVAKTVALEFPSATSSIATPQTPRVQFFSDNITSFALSPDGTQVAYLLSRSGASTGHIASITGTVSVRSFSLPLAEVTLAWPSANMLLAQSKPATGVPGIAFSIPLKSGDTTPLLYTAGLSAVANADFSKIIYQSADATRVVYSHDMVSGRDVPLSLQPFPEKCVWSPTSSVVAYCAAPLQYVAPNYLDLWHQGVASAADSILGFNVSTNVAVSVATPGSADGGVSSDIVQVAVSPDAHYLLFTTKGDRTLWGVRL